MSLEHIFVYGTLKADQCRGDQWPLQPVHRCRGWTLGALYDLGPYPALYYCCDDDPQSEAWVLGEVWSFHADDLPQVLDVLDAIEVTNQPGMLNEYDRERVVVELEDGGRVIAQTYIYCDRRQLTDGRRVRPWLKLNGKLMAVWPRASKAN